MTLRTPTSFTAGRRVVLGSTTYEPGDTVPNATVKGLADLAALVSRRILIPDAPIRAGTNRAKRSTPGYISPSMRKGL